MLGLGAVVGCGGKVTFEGDGSGGGSTSSSATSTHASSVSTGTGPHDCGSLEKVFQGFFDQAVACSTCVDANPCFGGLEIHDACGCPAGTANQAFAKEANQAYDAWVAAGCGPHLCQIPCFNPGQTWTCAPSGMQCNGTCVAGVF